ncbi:MAG: NirD/YgiW/YdeI family stress tolerance protein, partial [Treponema sp.]|nr:NirD/YgiW/YdeI family stress tolerance protein [Treponema sp.]
IIRALGDEWYRFRDETGEIFIEIDRGVWHGLSVSENDRVEITGKLESGLGRAVIDVKSIRKI